jgi:uncharacterized protein YkwD
MPAVITAVPTSRRLIAVALLALSAAAVLLAGQPRADAATSAETAAAKTVLATLNAERTANHLPILGWSTALSSSAHNHNVAMDRTDVMSHQLPGEPGLGARISAVKVGWHFAAENIAWTSDRSAAGAKAIHRAMYNEKAPNDGHRRNMLSAAVRYVGIDVIMDATHGKLWLTEDFSDAAGPTGPSHIPVGRIDSVTVAPRHLVMFTGWTFDPDATSAPLAVAVYRDGHLYRNYGSGVARPDVARTRHVGPREGFHFGVGMTGRHRLCLYARNIGLGSNVLLGCVTVTA